MYITNNSRKNNSLLLLQDLLMYLLQLVQALKYESFSDIQGGLDPGSKRDSQGLSDDSALDRSARHDKSNHQYVNTTNISDVGLFPHLHHAVNFFFCGCL